MLSKFNLDKDCIGISCFLGIGIFFWRRRAALFLWYALARKDRDVFTLQLSLLARAHHFTGPRFSDKRREAYFSSPFSGPLLSNVINMSMMLIDCLNFHAEILKEVWFFKTCWKLVRKSLFLFYLSINVYYKMGNWFFISSLCSSLKQLQLLSLRRPLLCSHMCLSTVYFKIRTGLEEEN